MQNAPLHLHATGFELHAGLHTAASVIERHTHDTPTLCSVRYGRFTEYYPGKAVDCDARTLKLTPAGEPHWNRFAPVDTFGVRVDVDPRGFADTPAIARLLEERVFLDAAAFGPISAQLLRELERPDELSALALEGLLLELLARMARLRWGGEVLPGYVRRAQELVTAQFRTPLSVEDVARAVGVPAAHLARAFRRAYGCTVAQRVRQLRLEAADRDLVSTSKSIASVALDAGFYDQSHFSNAYRRYFGSTPAARRRLARTH